jgi:hypothetical protein
MSAYQGPRTGTAATGKTTKLINITMLVTKVVMIVVLVALLTKEFPYQTPRAAEEYLSTVKLN